MKNKEFIEFTCIDDAKAWLRIENINGLIEQKNIKYQNEKGEFHSVPDHCLLIYNNKELRLKDKYDKVKHFIDNKLFDLFM